MEDETVEQNIAHLLALLESDSSLPTRLLENFDEVAQAADIPISLDATHAFLRGVSEQATENFTGMIIQASQINTVPYGWTCTL